MITTLVLAGVVFGAAACGHDAPVAARPAEATVATDAPTASRSVAVASPAADRYDLQQDERRGGHTLARHVGRSDEQLIARLKEERVSAASTYTDRETAERVVGKALQENRGRIDGWAERQGNKPNLVLDYHEEGREPIGRSIRRGKRRGEPCFDALVVLRADRGRGYYVLTSYPEAKR